MVCHQRICSKQKAEHFVLSRPNNISHRNNLWGLPEHFDEQGFFWTGLPEHGCPPFLGPGLLQVRVRFWVPLPHRVEQPDQEDQVDHSPSTEKMRQNININSWATRIQTKVTKNI